MTGYLRFCKCCSHRTYIASMVYPCVAFPNGDSVVIDDFCSCIIFASDPSSSRMEGGLFHNSFGALRRHFTSQLLLFVSYSNFQRRGSFGVVRRFDDDFRHDVPTYSCYYHNVAQHPRSASRFRRRSADFLDHIVFFPFS